MAGSRGFKTQPSTDGRRTSCVERISVATETCGTSGGDQHPASTDLHKGLVPVPATWDLKEIADDFLGAADAVCPGGAGWEIKVFPPRAGVARRSDETLCEKAIKM